MKNPKAAVSLLAAASIGAGACSSGRANDTSTTNTTSKSTTSTSESVTTTTSTSAPVSPSTTRTRPTTPKKTTTTLGNYRCGPYQSQDSSSQGGSTTSSSTSAPTSTSSSSPPTSGPPPTAIVVCGRPYRRPWRRGKLVLPDPIDVGPIEGELSPEVLVLSEGDRVGAGQSWLQDARSEAASVPAFAELSLHLAAVGAPIALVHDAHAAALDEIRHTERCLSMASMFLGRVFEFGVMPSVTGRRVAGRWWWSRKRHLNHLAVASLLDGCVSEGNSADYLRARAARSIPEAATVAERLARDEDRHTALAWQIVEWCRAEGGRPVDVALEKAMRKMRDAQMPAAVRARYRQETRLPALVPRVSD